MSSVFQFLSNWKGFYIAPHHTGSMKSAHIHILDTHKFDVSPAVPVSCPCSKQGWKVKTLHPCLQKTYLAVFRIPPLPHCRIRNFPVSSHRTISTSISQWVASSARGKCVYSMGIISHKKGLASFCQSSSPV